jgi:hypothetical protein
MDYLSEAYLGYTPVSITKLIGDKKSDHGQQNGNEKGKQGAAARPWDEAQKGKTQKRTYSGAQHGQALAKCQDGEADGDNENGEHDLLLLMGWIV